jgi:serine/threonine protein kinase
LLYVLITGYWPYAGTTQAAAKKNVEKGCTTFAFDLLPDNDDLIRLLQSMLSIIPSERPSVSQVLGNRWLLYGLDQFVEALTAQQSLPTESKRESKSDTSSIPKSSSQPDMVELTSTVVIKSPRKRRTSLKEDFDIRDVAQNVPETGPDNFSKVREKKKNKTLHAVFSLFSKLRT